jgi:Carboxypeptidase regulatory-like domain
VIAALSLPLSAADKPTGISGYVRDTSGIPQMGAVVEIIGTAARTLTVFTDGAGYYYASDLVPGLYTVKVSAASFLPAWRDRIGIHTGANTHVNITLTTLLNAMRVGPLRATPNDDDWKWTLRSVANRPVLRIFDDPSSTSNDADKDDHDLTGTLSFVAGSVGEGYGSGSDMSTGFLVERSVFSTDRVAVSGNVGYGDSLPAAVIRGIYSHPLPDGSGPSMGVVVHRFAPSDPNLHNASLQAVGFSAADDITAGNLVELKFGSELQTIQFLGRMTAFRPFGSADVHVTPDTIVSYGYTTSLPHSRQEQDFDSGPSDTYQTDPRVSVDNFTTKLESARHQELSVSQRLGNTNAQLAVFDDQMGNTALLGAGSVSAASGSLLPDVYSGTFTFTGGTLRSEGLRLVLQHKMRSDLTATFDWSCGNALDLGKPGVDIQDAEQAITTVRRQAASAKLSGKISRTHTRWAASYRWINGPALTPVDMFNASPGQADPYFNLFIRQPLPTLGFLPGHMEALLDVRNLLAQGYVPVIGQDGQTVYFVQSARSVRGGVTISF